ncbi:MAG: hypothetical protein CVU03_04990 [Bacteroidetes bacterium HGW-Bacteroidetes-2]|jgi:hypothetical protein|nr:MAG: hypothetical protein CVU03_04990 [Bacteroidetes bacterium HGW-Bacteroidetes-2]
MALELYKRRNYNRKLTSQEVDANWDAIEEEFSTGAGGADKTFVFNQPTPASVWNIAHNLGKYASVTVVDSANEEAEGLVTYTNNNNLIITFSAAFSGKAFLN